MSCVKSLKKCSHQKYTHHPGSSNADWEKCCMAWGQTDCPINTLLRTNSNRTKNIWCIEHRIYMNTYISFISLSHMDKNEDKNTKVHHMSPAGAPTLNHIEWLCRLSVFRLNKSSCTSINCQIINKLEGDVCFVQLSSKCIFHLILYHLFYVPMWLKMYKHYPKHFSKIYIKYPTILDEFYRNIKPL